MVIFPAGIALDVPEIDTESSDLPPWREELNEESGEEEYYEEIMEG